MQNHVQYYIFSNTEIFIGTSVEHNSINMITSKTIETRTLIGYKSIIVIPSELAR